MSHSMTRVTCQHAMTDLVERLKSALGVSTDQALAQELGLERSTVAQWRRRGSVPAIYREIIAADEVNDARAKIIASRQHFYGDSRMMYLVRAALAYIPSQEFEDNTDLSAALLGDHRERLLLNVGQVVQEACRALFGRSICESENEYDKLVKALGAEPFSTRIRQALQWPTLGEHL